MVARKIVLVGAGSLQFGLGSAGSILDSEVLTGSTILLHDINEESLELARTACQAAVEDRKLDFNVEATTDRAEALRGADFVINSIEVAPRFELWDQDFEVPRELGNRQVMGENGGPGGLFHSLRVIPPILEICADVQKICPGALFINFSNPMSRICLAISRKFPKLNFVGLCHEIKFVELYFPKILGTTMDNLDVKAGGLNHFGVVLQCRYRGSGRDAYPDIRARAPGFLKSLKGKWDVDLTRYVLETYGYIPYTYDSHFGEYIHWAWEKVDFEGIRRFVTSYRAITLDEGKRIRRLIKKGKGARLVQADDERAVPIIEGILTDAGYEEMSVNLPNDGVISNLPRDLVVECPAKVDKTGVHPVPLGEFPRGLAALLRTQASVQDLVVEAAIQGSRELALQALLADPVVDSTSQAEAILDAMLDKQARYIHLN
ncbi:MAG: family 4 glycosyl hydrolase [Promethearchaeota archaeon]